jgi:beta-glucosidase
MSDTNPLNSLENQVEALLSQLTLEEKCALLSGKDNWNTVPIERLGIPMITMTDGPHGVRANRAEADRLTGPTTAFPTGVSMAATWNPALIEQVSQALAEETLGMGCDILLGPCVNIVRHPLAGRNFESYSEDPYLAGQIGIAWVNGLQSRGVGASLKHFACNNQEIERGRGDSVVDERTLREIYLSQFETIIKHSNPWTVMCSYNRLNGVYASQNETLLKQILKGEWGFDGAVVSDWGANHTIFESVAGGLDLEMPGPAKYYGSLLVEAVKNWKVEEEDVNEAVRRVLRLILRTGKMNRQGERPVELVNSLEHQQLALQVAEEAITLLKNEAGLLPLKMDQLSSIALIGPNLNDFQITGGGSSTVISPYQVNPLPALEALLAGRVELSVEPGISHGSDRAGEGIDRAAELAAKSDVAIVIVGLPKYYESEGYDRPDMNLPGQQDELVKRVLAANPKTIVVLNAGVPVTMPWAEAVPAILQAYYPGMEGGNAIARILLGEVNPSGKLTVSYPKRLEDTPAFINYPGTRQVNYGEGIFVGYRYYDKKGIAPLFPFGHGLSYTRFEYKDLVVPETIRPGEGITISLSVTNTGEVSGKEIVQVYVLDWKSSLVRPPKELKGFAKVALEAGETQQVSIALDPRAFSFYDPYRHEWIAEPGDFEILVGGSSRQIHLQARCTLP